VRKLKIAITLDTTTVEQVDRLVARKVFPSRSQAIQAAVNEKIERLERSRLARECAKLDRVFEKAMAEEGLGPEGDEWPEY
jgi:metal-responsive CopG/Arc/MetJ family transcriptional regulator